MEALEIKMLYVFFSIVVVGLVLVFGVLGFGPGARFRPSLPKANPGKTVQEHTSP